MSRFLISVPVVLNGEGNYNLDEVKQIVVTESFLGLDENTRGCQDRYSIENCTTMSYLQRVMDQCGCLPYNLWINEYRIQEVYIIHINF